MSKPIKVGVAGVGSLGFHHARILREVEGAALVGFYDSRPERRDDVSAELSVPALPTLEALLDQVDALIVAVPTTAHEEVASAALERGIHVMIEKPIAPSLDAADRILEKAAAGGAMVQIGHVERFNAVLRAGEPYIQDPLFVETHRLSPFGMRGTDVAVVLDLMIHDLDLVLSLMKRPIASIAAVGVPVLTASPDIANARLEFEGGGVASLTASRVSLERMRKIRFFQRSGYMSLDLAAGTGEFLRLKREISFDGAEPFSVAALADVIERIPLKGDGGEPLRLELESFVASIRGERPVAVSGEDGRRALAAALEAVKSIERHVAQAAGR